jgi:16S rRNA (adenine1518-N6/adenine1519-N6)-dimethyltransferase
MIEAKKKFGQNFLQDTSVLHKIIQAMPKNDRKLIEIGPGLGDLTQKLLEVKPVVAYEVDTDLCVYLKEKFSKEIDEKNLTLVQGDVLEKFSSGSLANEPYDLVANLPYYIATTIILRALKDPLCKSMVVMIQKEVAKKFSAPHKTKEFTSLAILAGSIAKAQILFDVFPESFEPQPKVVSSVLKIEKEKNFIGSDGIFKSQDDLDEFEIYLRYAFSAPRKTWLKNISAWVDKAKAKSILAKYEYKESIRPHELSVSSHHLLFNELRYKDGREKETRGKS